MTPAIERRMEFDASVERVWRALTDGRELASWFPDTAAFDMGEGVSGEFVWAEHGRYAVRVEAFEPPRYVAWRWSREADTPVGDGPSTLVEFRLSERPGGGTVLELRESGFERPQDRQSNVDGWTHELAELVELLRQ